MKYFYSFQNTIVWDKPKYETLPTEKKVLIYCKNTEVYKETFKVILSKTHKTLEEASLPFFKDSTIKDYWRHSIKNVFYKIYKDA